MSTSGIPVHFTYFINPVYLLALQDRMLYRPPHEPVGASAIGFAYSAKDVANRVEQINLALSEGNEIGSHAVGHWNGSTWSEADWKSELDQFSWLVSNVETNNGLVNETPERRAINVPEGGIVGFRAPLLGRNDNLYKVLAEEGYRYDTSGVAKPDVWPVKLMSGLWEFPLARINYASSSFKILSMDYNFYFKQSGAKDIARRGSPEWRRMYDDMLTSYRNYFDGNYAKTRAPVFIGHHFSQWNGGVYWEVMKEFARDECGKPEVRCVTYRELADYLDQHVSSSTSVTKSQ
jgi:peptidoglycan/xylan/chitin deacetylase (PgdA/CDA1 family)